MTLPLDVLAQRAKGDGLLARFGRDLDLALIVGDGDLDWLVEIERGVVARVTRGPLIMPRSDLRMRAASETWARFLEPVPPPGYHDLFAMRRYRRIQIEGDIRLMSAYLFYIKRLFELLRPREAGA
ncbi:MAG: hypothetical protein LJE90_10540 [Betaproteobacteria bacterium]|jgi:hypothetical protein|nr:hypothetical protein [Betaproteobacteria bacterium]